MIIQEIQQKSRHYKFKCAAKALGILMVQCSYSLALLAMQICNVFSIFLHLIVVPLLAYKCLVRLQIYKLRMTHFGQGK